MAITMTCPRCTHKNSFDDSKAGQEAHCRICHHAFKVPGEAKVSAIVPAPTPAKPSAPASPAAAPSPAASPPAPPAAPPPVAPPPAPVAREGVKQGPPRPDARKDRADPDKRSGRDTRRSDRRDRDDDDDDRDRPSRRRKGGSGLAIVFWILGGVGALLLLGCCGVVSIFVVLPAMGVAILERQVAAAIDQPAPLEFDPPPVVVNPPPINFNPPPPPPPPPPPKLDPRKPADGAEVLARLRNNGPGLDDAFRWLRDADLNHPSRREFAKQLDALVENQKNQVFPNGDFFDAYFRWATKEDNYDSLMRMVLDATFAPHQNSRRGRAMETLGRLQDARAAEAITQRLGNVFDRGAATKGMELMGAAGQPTLLKHMNDANGDIRRAAQDLLKKQGVTADMLLTQTLADLKSVDDNVRNAALDWLCQALPDDNRRPDVARALNGLITPQSLQGALYKALEIWGTAENGPTIANCIDGGNVFQASDRIKLLGRLKDPRTLPALASRIGKFGFEGNAAKDAIKQFGKAAEAEVIKYLLSPDGGTRHAACQLLGDIGTRKVSFPAMQRAVNAYPQDRQLDNHAKDSAKKILARGA